MLNIKYLHSALFSKLVDFIKLYAVEKSVVFVKNIFLSDFLNLSQFAISPYVVLNRDTNKFS